MSIKVKALTMHYIDDQRIREGEEFELSEKYLVEKDGKKFLPKTMAAMGKLPNGVYETCSEHEKNAIEPDAKIKVKEEKKKSMFGSKKEVDEVI